MLEPGCLDSLSELLTVQKQHISLPVDFVTAYLSVHLACWFSPTQLCSFIVGVSCRGKKQQKVPIFKYPEFIAIVICFTLTIAMNSGYLSIGTFCPFYVCALLESIIRMRAWWPRIS
jgi:hypothetical protein